MGTQVASPKGLFCGSGIAFRFHSGHQISLRQMEASLIPVGSEISDLIVSKSKFGWVLVVEKEVMSFTRRSTYPLMASCRLFSKLCAQMDWRTLRFSAAMV